MSMEESLHKQAGEGIVGLSVTPGSPRGRLTTLSHGRGFLPGIVRRIKVHHFGNGKVHHLSFATAQAESRSDAAWPAGTTSWPRSLRSWLLPFKVTIVTVIRR